MAEYRTLDNPNDIAIREQQRQQRLAMGATTVVADKIEPQFAEPFLFRFRRHINTQFGGLWELAVLDKKGHVLEIVTDADALPHALEAIGNIFANAGY